MKSLTTLMKRGQSSAQISTQLDEQRTEHGVVAEALHGLQSRRATLLIEGTDAQVEAIDKEIAAATRRRDRASAWIEKLQQDFSAAIRAEDQAEKRKRYDAAAAKTKAAIDWQRKRYPALAKELVAGLAAMQEAAALAKAANDDLPDDIELVPDPVRPNWRARRVESVEVPLMEQVQDRETGALKLAARGTTFETRFPDHGFDQPSLVDEVNLPSIEQDVPAYWTRRGW